MKLSVLNEGATNGLMNLLPSLVLKVEIQVSYSW